MGEINWIVIVVGIGASIIGSVTTGVVIYFITRKFNRSKKDEINAETERRLLIRDIKCLIGALMKMNGWGEKFYGEYLKLWKNYAQQKNNRDIIEDEVKDDLS